jgi:hypothetical protein
MGRFKGFPGRRGRTVRYRVIAAARKEGVPLPEVSRLVGTLTGGGSRLAWVRAVADVYDVPREQVRRLAHG